MDCSTPGFLVLHYPLLKLMSIESVMPSNHFTLFHSLLLLLSVFLGLPWWLRSKESPAMQETQEMWVQSLDGEDPLEENVATHSSILGR